MTSALPHIFEIDGVTNFRDQGGYLVGAKPIAIDCLYRSGHYADVTDNGIASVKTFALDRIVDLRDDYEREGFPSRDLGIETHACGGRLHEIAQTYDAPPTTEDEVKARKLHSYGLFHTRFHDGMNAVFGGLANGQRVLVHCTSGKDRTGFTGALLLRLLGVDDADIAADYMVSQSQGETMTAERKAAITKFYGYDDSNAAIVDLRRQIFPDLVLHALQQVESAHGSIASYLTGPCGLAAGDVSAIRDRFLG